MTKLTQGEAHESDAAAAATAAAVERCAPGVYDVVDDEPRTVAAWLPELAAGLRAPPPRHLPAWLGRIVTGDAEPARGAGAVARGEADQSGVHLWYGSPRRIVIAR